jgi:2-amino-4-hydroxy-6-hydroxymethyldihydropteridine diphosphokinase
MPAAGRPPRAVRVAVALGSNLGDRAAHLSWATAQLAHLLDGLVVSPFEETAPLDVPDLQPDYLNAVAVGRSRLGAPELLDALLALERQRGRTRPGLRAARTLDLDLVLYGSAVIDDARLTVPHPRFRERPFVLGPLATLAPRWRDPVTGRTLAALWRTHRLPGGG